jgi:hypothetical protein
VREVQGDIDHGEITEITDADAFGKNRESNVAPQE